MILLLCPVWHGCESLHYKDGNFTVAGKVPVKMTVRSNSDPDGLSLDMLVFGNDALQYLECWQRVPVSDDGTVTVASLRGDKILMACCGMAEQNSEDWMWVSSYVSLSDAWTELEDEIADSPVMSGSCRFKAGSVTGEYPELSLRRVSSEIHLRSLRCDFRERPYDGEVLSDVQVYLTNVNASCRIWDNDSTASRIINQGRLIMEDVARFKDSSMIWQRIESKVGTTAVYTDIRLRCYPNAVQEEGPGSPFTRLVIQGVLDGDTWYWPIDINRSDSTSHGGVTGNCLYTYDIVLTRKGSADPDTAIKAGSASITMEVERWEDKENYIVEF